MNTPKSHDLPGCTFITYFPSNNTTTAFLSYHSNPIIFGHLWNSSTVLYSDSGNRFPENACRLIISSMYVQFCYYFNTYVMHLKSFLSNGISVPMIYYWYCDFFWNDANFIIKINFVLIKWFWKYLCW